VIVAACTTSLGKSYPFLIPITADESGLPKDSVINVSHIMTIDKKQTGRQMRTMNREENG